MTDSGERTRRVRTTVSAVLLAVGSVAFWVSLVVPAVVRSYSISFGTAPGSADREFFIDVDGWDWFVGDPLTLGNSAFLALAFAFWVAATRLRSVWARWIGVGASVATVLVPILRVRLDELEVTSHGWWLWMTGSVLVGTSFLMLPAPVRPPPDESLPREDADRGRTLLAWIVGGAASVALVGSHLLVTTRPSLGSIVYLGGGRHDWVEVSTLEIDVSRSVAVQSVGSGARGWAELSWLLLPVAFVVIANRRRANWRWLGAVWAVALAVVQFAWVGVPWADAHDFPSPALFLWYGPPVALVAAFLLMPPRRDAAGPGPAETPLALGSRPSP